VIEPLKDSQGVQVGMQARPPGTSPEALREAANDRLALRRWVTMQVTALEERFMKVVKEIKGDLLLMERLQDHCVEEVGRFRLVMEAPTPKPVKGLERIFKVREDAGDYK
jgi:hypothetical protein